MYSKIESCRICGGKQLAPILDLGEQTLTGVFPSHKNSRLTSGPLRLVKCIEAHGCGLVQLEHSYDLEELYGDNYGYRSGLNRHMVAHLQNHVDKIIDLVDLSPGDMVVDIGSNDATTLKSFPNKNIRRVGIDPTGEKFRQYYSPDITLIPDFFSDKVFRDLYPDSNPKIITSFAMFYDLERPMNFMQQIYDILDDDGIWVFEQSYLGSMIETNSYDTICHEHLEYYAIRQIQWMAEKIGFRICDFEFNDINGGSIAITMCKQSAEYPIIEERVEHLIEEEAEKGYQTLDLYEQFANNVSKNRVEILEFIADRKTNSESVCGLGASTKGNVILQYCGLTSDDLEFIGEVNRDKFGCYTPGTHIPIRPEDDLFTSEPDYVLVLPWHFRQFFLDSSKFNRFRLVFPLPKVEIIPPRA